MIKAAYALAFVALLCAYAVIKYEKGCGPDAVRIGGIVVASCDR